MIAPLPRRRWFRFGLRTLLVFTLLVGLLMGWIARERMQSAREMAIAEALERQGWRITTAGRFYSEREVSPGTRIDGVWDVWWQPWVRQVLGVRIIEPYPTKGSIRDLSLLRELSMLRELDLRFCHNVDDISPLARLTTIQNLNLALTSVSDLSPLVDLTMLEKLELGGTPVTDLSPLTGLVRLKSLGLIHTQISKVEPLAGLTSLEELALSGTEVSDLTPLRNLKGLRSLDVRDTNVSRESVHWLQSILPDCQIRHDFSD